MLFTVVCVCTRVCVHVCVCWCIFTVLSVCVLTQNCSIFSKTSKTEEETEEYEFQAELYEEQPFSSASFVTDQEQRIRELEEQLSQKEEECNRYRRQLEVERFGIQRFSAD